jgi:hypothetical protein
MNISQNKIKIELLIILIIIYYFSFLSQQIWIGKDSAVYLLLARSLIQGKGYIDPFVAMPKINSQYPAGYPFLLSLAMRIFGEGILPFRILTIFLMAASLFILTKIIGTYLRKKEDILVFLLFALNSHLLVFAHTIASEAGYFLFSWLGLLFFMRNENTLSLKKVALGTLFMVAAFYMRIIGISLYLALAIYLLLCRKYRQAFLVLLFAGIFVLPWMIYVLTGQGGNSIVFWLKDINQPSSGTFQFLDIPLRLLTSLKYYSGKIVAELLFFPYLNAVTFGNLFFAFKIILSLFFSLLFLRGFYLSVKKCFKLLDIYVLVYLFCLLLWPLYNERLLLPIYPFLLGYLFIALREVRFKLLKAPVILSLFIAVIMANFGEIKNVINKNQLGKPCLAEALPWLEANTPPEAVVMSEDPAGVYFYIQRKGAFLNLSIDPVQSLAKINADKANYILLQKGIGLTVRGRKIDFFERYGKPLLEKYPFYFKLVYQGTDKCGLLIYKINISRERP